MPKKKKVPAKAGNYKTKVFIDKRSSLTVITA